MGHKEVKRPYRVIAEPGWATDAEPRLLAGSASIAPGVRLSGVGSRDDAPPPRLFVPELQVTPDQMEQLDQGSQIIIPALRKLCESTAAWQGWVAGRFAEMEKREAEQSKVIRRLANGSPSLLWKTYGAKTYDLVKRYWRDMYCQGQTAKLLTLGIKDTMKLINKTIPAKITELKGLLVVCRNHRMGHACNVCRYVVTFTSVHACITYDTGAWRFRTCVHLVWHHEQYVRCV